MQIETRGKILAAGEVNGTDQEGEDREEVLAGVVVQKEEVEVLAKVEVETFARIVEAVHADAEGKELIERMKVLFGSVKDASYMEMNTRHVYSGSEKKKLSNLHLKS